MSANNLRQYPLMEEGVREMNHNPEKNFAEVEQSAFSAANMVTDIFLYPGKIFQARIIAHGDVH